MSGEAERRIRETSKFLHESLRGQERFQRLIDAARARVAEAQREVSK